MVLPGRMETTGGMPPIMGIAPRDLTLEDAEILARTVTGIDGIAPMVIGNAEASFESRGRDSMILGTSRNFFAVRNLSVSQGKILPDMPATLSKPVAVIGQTVKEELFGNGRAVGQWLRIRDYRLRIIGVLTDDGDSVGLNMREAVIIPVATAQSLFNVHGLFRLGVRISDGSDMQRVSKDIEQRMTELHEGELDITVVSPDAMIETLNDILQVLTLGVGGIAAISLLVAGIMVMNVTLVSVRQRTTEIGLLKALGATSPLIRNLFLTEAGLLAVLGLLAGLAVGHVTVNVGRELYPSLPLATPVWATISACVLALVVALVFAWLPAQQAAQLEPVEALEKK